MAPSAYRARLTEYHPDEVAHIGKELREVAARKALEIKSGEPLSCFALSIYARRPPFRIAVCGVLVGEVRTESEAGSFELLPVGEIW